LEDEKIYIDIDVEYKINQLNLLKEQKLSLEYTRTYNLMNDIMNSLINLTDTIFQYKNFRNTDELTNNQYNKWINNFINNQS